VDPLSRGVVISLVWEAMVVDEPFSVLWESLLGKSSDSLHPPRNQLGIYVCVVFLMLLPVHLDVVAGPFHPVKSGGQ